MDSFHHGGQINHLAEQAGVSPDEILDLSASIHPFGFPQWTRSLISSEVEKLVHYPEDHSDQLKKVVAQRYQCSTSQVLCGNGSSELLYCLARALEQSRMVIPVPAYVDYYRAFEVAGWDIIEVSCFNHQTGLHEWRKLYSTVQPNDFVILGHPINPTGQIMPIKELKSWIKANPKVTFIIDEAFADYLEDSDRISLNRPTNVMVLCSLTKFYAMPGLRCGMLLADQAFIQSCRDQLPPWSMNHLAQQFAIKALSDIHYPKEQRLKTVELKACFMNKLRSYSKLKVYASQANYVLIKTQNAQQLSDHLLNSAKIAVRQAFNFRSLSEHFIRISLPDEHGQERLFEALNTFYKLKPEKKQKTYRLMIQGTASNAGKSLIVTALCRIFSRRGLNVAPFKSQNMSLNSCVCRDGYEIARAQLLQSMACSLPPAPEMNPILLKPDGPGRSQVVVLGKSRGSMSVKEYHAKHKEFFEISLKAFADLSQQVDLVIVEGAGSISEINLRDVDLVNMPFAEAIQAPTLIVGNIDLGGVYGSLVGSMELLSESKRKLVKGYLINRFRGDASLLKPAHDEVKGLTHKPFLGVVNYLDNLRLPEEDSVAFSNPKWGKSGQGQYIDIVVIDVGYASNVNDFEALLLEEDVQLRKVTQVDQLGHPDVVILPGSKNIFLSLENLKATGLSSAITNLNNIEILGICGGLALLSNRINDPHGVEAKLAASEKACGLLDLEIELQKDKRLTHTTVTWSEFAIQSSIYEMHNGKIINPNSEFIAMNPNGIHLAWRSPKQPQIWGTWCHGLFDDDAFRRAWLNRLRVKKGWKALAQNQTFNLEVEIDRWADHVEKHCDIDAIWKIIQKD